MGRAELGAALAAFPDRLSSAARAVADRPVPDGEWSPEQVVHGQRRLARPGRRLDPPPVRILLGREIVEPREVHLGLDGDEVADDEIRGPLAVGDGPTRRRAGGRGHFGRHGGEGTQEIGSGRHASSIERRHASVASTALNVYRWKPVTRAAGSASSGAIASTNPVGL